MKTPTERVAAGWKVTTQKEIERWQQHLFEARVDSLAHYPPAHCEEQIAFWISQLLIGA